MGAQHWLALISFPWVPESTDEEEVLPALLSLFYGISARSVFKTTLLVMGEVKSIA